jgi:hypothetical protein
MQKSATEVMQEILYAADAVVALKARSAGLPNNLLRDLNAIHANTTFADLPPEVQAAISTSVRSALGRLLREGYSVSPAQGPGAARPERPQRPGGPGGGPARPHRRPPPRHDGPDGPRPPRKGGRPPRKPPSR